MITMGPLVRFHSSQSSRTACGTPRRTLSLHVDQMQHVRHGELFVNLDGDSPSIIQQPRENLESELGRGICWHDLGLAFPLLCDALAAHHSQPLLSGDSISVDVALYAVSFRIPRVRQAEWMWAFFCWACLFGQPNVSVKPIKVCLLGLAVLYQLTAGLKTPAN